MYYQSDYSDEKKLAVIQELCDEEAFQKLLAQTTPVGIKNRTAHFLLSRKKARAYHELCKLLYFKKGNTAEAGEPVPEPAALEPAASEEPAAEAAAEPVEETADEDETESTEETAEEEAAEQAEETAEEAAEEESDSEPIEEPVAETVGTSSEEPVEEAAEESAEPEPEYLQETLPLGIEISEPEEEAERKVEIRSVFPEEEAAEPAFLSPEAEAGQDTEAIFTSDNGGKADVSPDTGLLNETEKELSEAEQERIRKRRRRRRMARKPHERNAMEGQIEMWDILRANGTLDGITDDELEAITKKLEESVRS